MPFCTSFALISKDEDSKRYPIVNGKLIANVVGHVEKNDDTDNLFRQILEKQELEEDDKIYVKLWKKSDTLKKVKRLVRKIRKKLKE